ncbi:AAA family ATPase [Desulfocastanea catecholica]
MSATKETFLQAMQQAGLIPPDEIIADGKIHRFPCNGRKNDTAGWYLYFGDSIPAGSFGSWRDCPTTTWRADIGRQLTPEEEQAHRDRVKVMRQLRDAEEEKLRTECRKWCVDIWQKSKDATGEHLYLKEKGVQSYGLKQLRDSLLIPLRDVNGTIQGMQFIPTDGSKKFKTGSAKQGNYYSIGKPQENTLLVCEGYATGASLHESTGHAVAVAFDAGNLKPVAENLRKKFPDMKLIICADNDGSGVGRHKADEAAAAVDGMVATPPDTGDDFNDLHQKRGLAAVKNIIESADIPKGRKKQSIETMTDEVYPQKKKIYPVDIINFLGLQFPPRENLMSPWLPSQGLVMLYAGRGIGKTHLALGVAYAVASGGPFLGWQAPSPAGVLYIDGEMPGIVMQERLGAIIMSNDKEPVAPFILLTPDLQPEGMPRIDTEEGQQAIDGILTDDIKLIVVDNISTLSGAKENDADGWTPIQAWALRQRAAGRSILFVHHSGKGGQQRGTSRREDVLDTVISLKRPMDYQPDQGAVFEIHFEKARGIYGDDVKSLEATLTTDEHGKMTWLTRTVEAGTFDRVVALLNEGMKQNEIAIELGLHKSNVSRHAKKAKNEGLVTV